MGTKQNQQAVVIGGSLTGLFTAEVLSRHFEKVSVLERDQLMADKPSRRGVPQARHVHVLLARGIAELERLFPGLVAEIETYGGGRFDWGAHSRVNLRGRWLPRFSSGISGLNCSRQLLEERVRARVRANPRITLRDGAPVVDLAWASSKRRVTGVIVGRQARENVPADWVVDASGRLSRLPHWLQEAGYPAVTEQVVDGDCGYASLRLTGIPAQDWRLMFFFSDPPQRARAGMLLREEGDTWVLTLIGAGGDYPPLQAEEFCRYAHTISPELAAVLKTATPMTPISATRKLANRWRRYARLAPFPGRLAVLGDAVCAFNPYYGQGMTVGLLSARALDESLQFGVADERIGYRLRERVERLTQQAWLVATSEDYRWTPADGSPPPLTTRWAHWYFDQIAAAAHKDVQLIQHVLDVQHMLATPRSLFRPQVMWRMLANRWA